MTPTDEPGPTLDDRQATFCREYICDFNASRAARAAGYAPGTVRGHAHALLQNVAIGREIDRLIRERAERTLVTADRVVLELAAVAFSSFDDYVITDAGELELADDADPLAARAVASVRKRKAPKGRGDAPTDGFDTQFRLWNKLDALRLLMRHLGMLDQKLTVAGNPDRAIQVNAKVDSSAALPADATVLEFLRRLGLPCPGDPPAAVTG